MNNKLNKVKWTKKFKALIISLSLVFAVALGGACTALGLSLSDGDKLRGGTPAGSVADDNTPAIPEADRTYSAGVTFDEVTYATNEDAWAAAVKYSLTENKVVQFDLKANWTADAATGFGAAVADDPEAETLTYNNSPFGAGGALRVPTGATVILNIAKGISLNRNITQTAGSVVAGGSAVSVSGTLYLTGEGTVKGGNVQYGGGIHVSGKFYMYGGTVSGNMATSMGGGVYVTGGTFTMYGGTVSDNNAERGAGVYINNGQATHTIYGGAISNNTATNAGGGIYIYEGELNLLGGEISNNVAAVSGGGIYSAATTSIVNVGAKAADGTLSGTAKISGNKSNTSNETWGGGGILNNGVVNVYAGEISGNSSNKHGGGIRAKATVTIEGGTISNNSSAGHGGGIYSEATGVYEEKDGKQVLKQAGLTINGGTISGNTASKGVGNGNGGGIFAIDGSVEINGGTFSKNIAGNGGAMFINSQFIMTDGIVENNEARWRGDPNGGGIYLKGAGRDIPVEDRVKMEISGGIIRGNDCSNAGDGFFLTHGTELVFTEGNTVEVSENVGNAIFAEYSSNITVYGGKFINNYGRAFNMSAGVLTIYDATVSGNSNGGVSSNNTVNIYGGKFENNTSSTSGGAIYSTGPVTITKTEGVELLFNNNTALNGAGGAIYCTGTLEVTGATFTSNKSFANASGDGGAISSSGTSATITNCIFKSNLAGCFGGALSLSAATTTVKGCTFGGETEAEGNQSSMKGGAICFDTPANLTLESSTFKNNKAADIGGAIYFKASTGAATIKNVTITNNYSGNSGGAIFTSRSLAFSGLVTIKDNYLLQPPKKIKNNLFIETNTITLTYNSITSGSAIGVSANGERTLYSGASTATIPTLTADDALWKLSDSTASGTRTVKLVRNLPAGVTDTNASLWNYAAKNSSDANPIVVTLQSDWTWADSTGFGSGDGFTTDKTLLVPANKNIVLNLNGKNINRGLTSSGSGTSSGYIFDVKGTLTIIGDGQIKGCNRASSGGAMNVSSTGKLIISGGTITGNKAYSGGAISVNGGTVIMNAGTISGNTAGYISSSGGGIWLYNATFEMHGGYINSNKLDGGSPLQGYGIYANKTNVTIDGGIISNNIATGENGNQYGGGVFLDDCTAKIGGTAIIMGNSVKTAGGVYACGGTSLEISGGKICNNTATAGSGAGVYVEGSSSKPTTVTMTGGEIYGNRSKITAAETSGGGGVYVNAYATFTMTGGKIRDNYAEDNTDTTSKAKAAYGGGVYVASNGTFNLGTRSGSNIVGNGEIYGNYSSGDGAGIFSKGGSVNLNSGKIYSNNALLDGGGLQLNGGTVNMYLVKIYSNSATSDGGGVAMKGSATFNMYGGEIYDNSANPTQGNDNGAQNSSVGGGLYIIESTFIMKAGSIYRNKSYYGGGVFGSATSNITIDGGKIYGNTARYGAGVGTRTTATKLAITGGEIYDNVAAVNGGGVFIEKTGTTALTFTISGTANIHNNSALSGGGVYLANATLTMTGGKISDNSAIAGTGDAAGRGGGVCVAAGATFNLGTKNGSTLTGTGVISGNYAPQDGGGVYVRTETNATLGTNNATFNMNSGEIKENRSTYGAGVYVFGKATVVAISGGTISKNIAAYGGGGGGLYVGYYAGGTMSGGTITENTSGGNGGGVFVSQNSKFTMTGGVISKNAASTNGGGVHVYSATSEFELKGTAKITENTAVNGAAGVYTAGTLTMDGSAEISNNTSGYGAGVYIASGEFTLKSGKISGNSSTNASGGGVSVNGTNSTFNMNGGEISGNNATASGGGVYVSGIFNMTDGEITGNTVNNYAAGVLLNVSGVMNMSGGEISGNNAAKGGGGVLIAFESTATINVSGKPVIAGNTAAGKADNVSLQHTQVINVTSALNSAADIGVTISGSNGKRVFTSGLASGGLSHPNVVFSADKKELVVGISGTEATLLDCKNINLTIYDKDGNATETTAYIKVDENTKVTYALSADKSKFTFTSTQGGRTGITTVVNVPLVAGYTPYVYDPDDSNAEVASGEGLLESVSADRNLRIGYKANSDTAYTVYYILQAADGSYIQDTTPAQLEGKASVKKYTGAGTTDKPLKYLDEDGKALTTFTNSQHYSFDEIAGDTNIKGDGTTYVLVYMKLNEYTVSFTASGATNGMQKKSFKYGSTISDEGLKTPSKDMNTFAGWYYDAACTEANKVNFGTDTVTGDITVYAKFTTKQYTLIFDLNLGSGDNQLDTALVLQQNAAGLAGHKVVWDTDTLFPGANGFDFKDAEGTGRYQITYDVNNVASPKNLLGIRPSAIGYTFLGWFASETATSQTQTIRKPAASTADTTTLTARWQPAQYTMRFDKRNGSRVETKEPTNLSLWNEILPVEPTYAGYTFAGWYTTEAAAKDPLGNIDIFQSSSLFGDDADATTAKFSIYDFGSLYGNVDDGYNFNNLTIYAGWKSVEVRVRAANSVENPMQGGFTFKTSTGATISETASVNIGDVVTVEIEPDPGYTFNSMRIGSRVSTAAVTTETVEDENGKQKTIYVTSFTVASRDIIEDDGKLYVEVSATFTEERYTITYDTTGGKSTDSTFARTYSASEMGEESLKRAKLPSLLTKRGYTFAGWVFGSNNDVAYDTYDEVNDETGLYGAELFLKRPYDYDETGYRNITLKAVWTPQVSYVYLYNATYSAGYNYDNVNKRYIIGEENNLKTDMDIEIDNPSRGDSFVFQGWATSRNGVVVYPAVNTKNTVTYKINAHKDEKGNLLNRNNLYAVWHIAGVNYIIMSADNNGCTYGGDGITMSAQTARQYDEDEATDISLNYTWYRIFEGHYDACFDVKDFVDSDDYKVYVDSTDEVVAYEKDGKYYAPDKTTEITKEQAEAYGSKLTYKEFNATKALEGGFCEVKKFINPETNKEVVTTGLSPEDVLRVNVRNVKDCGVYVCVVEVSATGEGSTSKTDGYGEIEITMNKAVYSGVDMTDTTVSYNTAPRYDAIFIKNAAGKDPTVETDGVKYLTLPDGSKLIVTYKYYVGTGEARTELTDLNQVKTVGTYHVEASFAFTPDGDKGNYELPEAIDADLIITPDTIGNLQYEFVHGETKVTDTTKFNGPYDGEEYKVVAKILDTTGIGANSLVTAIDDVAFDVKVYRVTETGGSAEVTEPTTEAGSYYLQIVGLTGDDADNYELGSGLTLRADYSIGKKAYAVAGHISFDNDEVTFDNELHTVSIKLDDGYTIPEDDVKVVYKTNYEAEEEDFTAGRLTNEAPDKNGGRYAGVYTVTVEFEFKTEAAKNNYAELESMSATLTIKKANFFDFYNVDGKDLLRDAGFVNAAYAYTVDTEYHPYITGGMLTDTDNFGLSYEYYRVTNEDTGERTMLASGTHAELVAQGDLISLAGKYEIVARIKFVSALYRNNFEEIKDSESTVTYAIRAVDVAKIEVLKWKDVYDEETGDKLFDKTEKIVSLGTGFDYRCIDTIRVTYAQDSEGQGGGTRDITRGTDIALAGIKLEKKNNVDQTTFWKVGAFNVIVSFYGTDSDPYVFTVKETITSVQVQYSKDNGNTYKDVTDEGVEFDADATYKFIILYKGTTTDGKVGEDLQSTATAAAALQLGSNKLNVSEANYIFANEITVDMYKVIDSGITWQYKLGNGAWTDMPANNELVYAGAEYKIRATFMDGTDKQELEVTNDEAVYNVSDYVLSVGKIGNYKLTAEYSFNVVPLPIEVTSWTSSELKYNSYHQSPEVKTSNRAAADEELLIFDYEFTDKEGNSLTAANVVNVGEYVVKLVLTGPARNNYTLVNSTTAMQAFTITQAEIEMEATYNEHNYGPNKTYAGNPQGLRLNAMKADFGEKAAIEGEFAFITNYNSATGKYDVVDGKSVNIANRNESLPVMYVYRPTTAEDKLNYKEKIGTIQLNVQKQDARSGAGALSVVFGEDAVQFYLVNQQFDTHGIEVYLLYQSTYEEDGVWYGMRSKIENPTFRIGSMAAQGYQITAQDLSSEKVVLRAINGSNSGTLDVSVVDKVASSIEVSSTSHRKEYYVGETFDFSDMEFRVLFGDNTSQDGLRKGSIKADFTGAFTEVGTKTVTFTYFNRTCTETFTVKPKEELQIINPTNLVLTYKNGAELAAPQLKAVVDGVTYAQSEFSKIGVSVRVEVTYKSNSQQATLGADKEGLYNVRYIFTVTNPRFNRPANINLDVRVTENPYKVDIDTETLDGRKVMYTGEYIAIPKPTVGTVMDTTTDTAVPANRVKIEYTINDVDVTNDNQWSRTAINRGAYVVTVTVKVIRAGEADYTAATASYTFEVTQAVNDKGNASINVHPVILSDTADFNFKVEADFGGDTAVLTYSRTRNGVYTTTKPNAAGTWFVKATIAGTNNYQGIDEIIESFEVRVANISSDMSGEGSVEGEIAGTDGIGAGWKLNIKESAIEDVNIKKQTALYGYTVSLLDENGVAAPTSGEYTIQIKLSDEQLEALNGKTIKLFRYDAEGKATEVKVEVKDGRAEFKTSELGRFVVTEAIPSAPGAPVGLIVGVSLGAVIAATLIALVIIVFLKKKRGNQ